jgi:uncharacterized protein YcgL (UPF0745 family)
MLIFAFTEFYEVRQAFIRNSSLLASVVGLYIQVGAKRMEMRRKPERLCEEFGAEEAVAVVTLANL